MADNEMNPYFDFALRVLKDQYAGTHGRRGEDGNFTMTLGELPDGLPAELPLKDTWRIVGSFSYAFDKPASAGWSVVLEAPESMQIIGDYLDEKLEEQGWKQRSMMDMFKHPRSGFEQSRFLFSSHFAQSLDANDDRSTQFKEAIQKAREKSRTERNYGSPEMYYKGDDQSLVLGVNLRVQSDNATSISIGITQDERISGHFSGEFYNSGINLPSLTPPDGVSISGGGGNFGPGEKRSSATATTTLSGAELEAHYAKQLEDAGWERTDGGVEARMARSSWNINGAVTGVGYLYIVRGFDSQVYVMSVEARKRQKAFDPFDPTTFEDSGGGMQWFSLGGGESSIAPDEEP